jgi:gluconolactonase
MRARAGLAAALLLAAAAAPADAGSAAYAIERQDPRLDALVAPDAAVEELADGFRWVEGPAWDARTGTLLFSDIPANAVLRLRPGGRAEVFLRPSGYSGSAPFAGREPGANGLAFDAEGRLVLCEHGDRRVTRLESDGTRSVLADRFEGRRLNSPNDVVALAGGDVVFTDPPFGLPRAFDDPGRELDFQGVYRRRADGALVLLTRDLRAPNGLAFSPASDVLYVSNADAAHPVWMAYPVWGDGRLGAGRVFARADRWIGRWPGLPDGLRVDAAGHLFAAGPGGVYVFAPDGTHLGTLRTGRATSNVSFGGDGSDLYVTADTAILRVRLRTRGGGLAPAAPR